MYSQYGYMHFGQLDLPSVKKKKKRTYDVKPKRQKRKEQVEWKLTVRLLKFSPNCVARYIVREGCGSIIIGP